MDDFDWKKLEAKVYQHFVACVVMVGLVAITFIGGCTAVFLTSGDPGKASVSIKADPDAANKHAVEKTQVQHRITEAQFLQVEVGMSWSQVLALLGEPAVDIPDDGQDVWKTVDNRVATVFYDEETTVTGTEISIPPDNQ